MSFDVDVLVVGAGPTGLTMASELLRRKTGRVRIIDTLERQPDQSRALGLQSRTLEVFEKMGVLKAILERGAKIQKLNLYEKGSRIGGVDFSRLQAPFPFLLSLPQSETEEILNAHLESLGGKVERPVTLTHMEEQKAVLSFPGGKQEIIHPRWIIGCDGAHSTVRHALNLPFKGMKFPEGFGLADVVIETPLNTKEAYSFMNPHGIFAILPLPKKDHVRLIASFLEEFDEKNLTLETWQNLILERTQHSMKIRSLIWSSIFFVHRRITSTLRVGSTFLCGDAAHIHSPVGGQGLNISVQDAFNLAWKLDLVHKNRAPETLLDTYQKERLPIAKKTLLGTTIATFFLTIRSFWIRKCLFKWMSFLLRRNHFQKRFTRAISQQSTHYKLGSWKDRLWAGPKPGSWAPLMENPTDLRYTLLVFGAPTFQPNLPNTAICHIPLGTPTAFAYKAKRPCLYLVRPDGYIAYRSLKIGSCDILSCYVGTF